MAQDPVSEDRKQGLPSPAPRRISQQVRPALKLTEMSRGPAAGSILSRPGSKTDGEAGVRFSPQMSYTLNSLKGVI